MHNLIPASRSYFFLPAFASLQAAMCTTLRAENIGRNWVERVRHAAAVISSSSNGALRAANPWRPDPDDKRTPIGPPDNISMHRRRWYSVRPTWVEFSLLAKIQVLKNSFNEVRVGLAHRALRDVAGKGQQFFNSFVFRVHAGSIRQLRRQIYSYFPAVIDIHAATVRQDAANKNVRGAAV